jgi:very-short-patch-repair endonuclease
MANVDRDVAEIAASQHCLFTLADVVACGGDKYLAKRRVKADRWERPYDGVFRLAGVPWTYEARLLAAILSVGGGACASHFCAYRMHGFGYKSAAPEISIPHGTFFRPKATPRVKVHSSRDLDRCDIVIRQGIPVTDPNRTLLDMARYLKGEGLMGVVEETRRKDDEVDWHSLIACVSTHARQGRHGITRMRELIETNMARKEVTDTDAELAALGLLREHGFGEPALQHRVFAEDGRFVAKIDIAYVADRVNFELNGPIHDLPEVKLKDQARDHELRSIYGWTVERIPNEVPVFNPRLFVNIVRQTFKEARAKRPTS